MKKAAEDIFRSLFRGIYNKGKTQIYLEKITLFTVFSTDMIICLSLNTWFVKWINNNFFRTADITGGDLLGQDKGFDCYFRSLVGFLFCSFVSVHLYSAPHIVPLTMSP